MEKSIPPEDKLKILKKIEDIGNRDFDGTDVTRQLRNYMGDADNEIVLSALQATHNYAGDEELFQEVLELGRRHPEEEVRAMACSCLGAVIQEGAVHEEEYPAQEDEGESVVERDFYERVKEFLLYKVDAPMESMEVRRRALEALGCLAFLPYISSIVLRFYHEAPNPFVKVSALYAMGLVRNEVFEQLILEELFSDHDDVVLEAVHSAAHLELHAALRRVKELVSSLCPDVRYESVVALGILAPVSELPVLMKALREEKLDDLMEEALEVCESHYKQRLMLDKGEPLWDDRLVMEEIQDMVDAGEDNGDDR